MINWIKAPLAALTMLAVGNMNLLSAEAADIFTSQGSPISIRAMDISYVKTPDYSVEGHRRARAEKHWLRLVLEYRVAKTNEGWLDDIRIDWAIAMNRDGMKPALMRLSIAYAEVAADGASHYAVAYIRPGFLERYGRRGRVTPRDLHVYAEVYLAGRLASGYHDSSTLNTRDRWWLDGGQRTDLVENALLSRLDTPFAPVDYDFYEHIIPRKN